MYVGEGGVGLPRCYFWINLMIYKKLGTNLRLSLEPSYAYFYQHGYTSISIRHAPEHKQLGGGAMSSYMLFSEKIQNGTEHWKI